VAYWKLEETHAEDTAFAEQVRSALLAVFGESAIEDPLFQDYFRPLHRQFPSLAPQKQIALAQILARERSELQRLGGMDVLQQQAALAQVDEATATAAREALSPEEFAEYDLRMSKLAEALRRLDLGLSEAEYRTLFARIDADKALRGILARTQPLKGPSRLLYRADLSSALGTDRYTRLLRQYDPVYFMMAQAAQQAGVSQEVLAATYTQTVESELRIAGLRAKGDDGAARTESSAQRKRLEQTFGTAAGTMFGTVLASLTSNPQHR
jgi:hypothetical protein